MAVGCSTSNDPRPTPNLVVAHTKTTLTSVHSELLPELSPFVKDIENRYKQFSGQPVTKAKKPSQEQLSLF
jgi:hypothetical protein